MTRKFDGLGLRLSIAKTTVAANISPWMPAAMDMIGGDLLRRYLLKSFVPYELDRAQVEAEREIAQPA